MAKNTNFPYDAKKLDDDIRNIDGERYNQSKISTFIIGRCDTYYSQAFKKEAISKEALSKICKYYSLKEKDYLLPDAPRKSKVEEAKNVEEKVVEKPIVVNIDIDPIIKAIEAMKEDMNKHTKILEELVAQQKSANFVLNQALDRLSSIQKFEKDILDKIPANRNRTYNNNANGIRKVN